MFDVIMPTKHHHNYIACLSIISLVRYFTPRRIYIITPKDNFQFFKNLQDKYPLAVLDEDYLIPEVNLKSLANFIEDTGQNGARAGWYFQQFLKMSACFLPDISDYYLIWDADTIMLNPIQFLNDKNQILIKPSSEYRQPYFDTYNKLVGQTRNVDFSFISEHFFVKSQYMRELIAVIENNPPRRRQWVWQIMNAIEPTHLSGAGFSEYETYGNFVNAFYPETFVLRPLKTIRYGTRRFGPIPNQYDLYRLSLSYAYASFESWDKGKPFRVWAEKLLSFLIYYAHPGRYLRR